MGLPQSEFELGDAWGDEPFEQTRKVRRIPDVGESGIVPAFLHDAPNDWRSDEDFLGRADAAVHCEEAMLRGGGAWERSLYLQNHCSEQSFRDVVDALDPDSRHLMINPPLAFEWMSLEKILPIDYQVFQVVMNRQISQWRDYGYESASHNIPTLYPGILADSTDFRIPDLNWIFSSYWRPGRLDLLSFTKNSISGRLGGATLPRYLCAHFMVGWGRRALELAGADRVASQHTSCIHDGDDHCEWTINWR